MNIIKTLTTTAVMVSLMMNVSTVANATPSVATAQEITAAGTAHQQSHLDTTERPFTRCPSTGRDYPQRYRYGCNMPRENTR